MWNTFNKVQENTLKLIVDQYFQKGGFLGASEGGGANITSSQITTALGYTPYNATNPSGFVTNSALSGFLTTSAASSTYFPLAGGVLNGSAGAGRINFPSQSSAPITPSTGFSLYANSSNALSWIGANGFTRTFDGTANTANRSYTLPDASGTFGLLGSTQTWSGINTFGNNIITREILISENTNSYLKLGQFSGGYTTALIEAITPGSSLTFRTGGVDRVRVDNNGLFGIATTAPTHSLTLSSTSTGWTHYNTSDQTTNYERVRGFWNGNTYQVFSENSGTGLLRDITISSGNRVRISTGVLNADVSPAGGFTVSNSNQAVALNLFTLGSFSFLNASSGTQNVFNAIPTINQSGTAGYRAIYVSPFEQATGSGSKLLLDLGTNSAANGSGTHTSRFSVANDGGIVSSYGRVFNTGNWFLGSSPVDAGYRLDVNGTARVQGDLASGGKLFFSTNTFFASNPSLGTISKQADHGLIFAGATGTQNDFAIGTVGGQLLFVNPTGTPAVALVPAVSGGNVLVGTSTQVPSAILTLASSTRGFLPPRITTLQRDAITSPAEGLVVYNTTTKKLNIFTTVWEQVTSS